MSHSETERHTFTLAFLAAGLKLSSCLIWKKNAATMGRADYQWQHEPILYGWRIGARHRWYGGRNKTSVADLARPELIEQSDGSLLLFLDGRVVEISGTDLALREVETSVLEHDKPSRSSLHPTTKPVELIERALLNSSRAGDLVLDPFGGSGSTLIAAERTRRRAALVELDPKFCDVICTRFQAFTGTLPVLEASADSHDFLAA